MSFPQAYLVERARTRRATTTTARVPGFMFGLRVFPWSLFSREEASTGGKSWKELSILTRNLKQNSFWPCVATTPPPGIPLLQVKHTCHVWHVGSYID